MNNVTDKIKSKVEHKMSELLEKDLDSENIKDLYQLVDIHKDVENEEYWKMKEDNMRYRSYGRESYGRENYGDSYGRRSRDSRGRYMEGEKMMNEMQDSYRDYADGKEAYGRGNYGAKEDSIKSLEYMLESVIDFLCMLEDNADSPEEKNIIKKYKHKISEM